MTQFVTTFLVSKQIDVETLSMADDEQGPPPPPAVRDESEGEREDWRIFAKRRHPGGCCLAGRVALGCSEPFRNAFERRCCRSKGQRRRRPGACLWTQRCLHARPCTVVTPSGGACCSSAPCDFCAASLLHPRRECVEWCTHGVPRPTGGGGLGSAL